MKDKDKIQALLTQNAALRLMLAINNQCLADIAGVLYDHDLHKEEDEVLVVIKMNQVAIG